VLGGEPWPHILYTVEMATEVPRLPNLYRIKFAYVTDVLIVYSLKRMHFVGVHTKFFARSKSQNVLACSNIGLCGSKPTSDIDVGVCVPCVWVVCKQRPCDSLMFRHRSHSH
jgi:hypothetical protein